jgi:hypothetical protein
VVDPQVDLTIKPLRAFDLLGLPFLKNWINIAVRNVLETTPIKVDVPQLDAEETGNGLCLFN